MSYMAAQTLIKSTLDGATAYFDVGDVTEADRSVLDQGRTNMAVIFPGSIPAHDLVTKRVAVLWGANVELYCRYNDVTSYNDFATLRDGVIARIEDNRCMSATYWVTSITAEADPVEVYDTQDGGPFFIMQVLNLTIQENV